MLLNSVSESGQILLFQDKVGDSVKNPTSGRRFCEKSDLRSEILWNIRPEVGDSVESPSWNLYVRWQLCVVVGSCRWLLGPTSCHSFQAALQHINCYTLASWPAQCTMNHHCTFLELCRLASETYSPFYELCRPMSGWKNIWWLFRNLRCHNLTLWVLIFRESCYNGEKAVQNELLKLLVVSHHLHDLN